MKYDRYSCVHVVTIVQQRLLYHQLILKEKFAPVFLLSKYLPKICHYHERKLEAVIRNKLCTPYLKFFFLLV